MVCMVCIDGLMWVNVSVYGCEQLYIHSALVLVKKKKIAKEWCSIIEKKDLK